MKILYVDMDGVLVDFESALPKLSDKIKDEYKNQLYAVPNIFSHMEPMPGAIDAYMKLCQKYDTYILTAAPWDNPTAANDKINWVKKYLPDVARKRIIITHNKNLNHGDYLIDDNLRNGVDKFNGKHIHFGSDEFPDWSAVLEYFENVD